MKPLGEYGKEFALSLPVVAWAGLDYYRRGWLGVRNRSPNMYTLIGLGVLVAYLYSIAATLTAGSFPPEMRDAHGMVGVYFEVAAAIMFACADITPFGWPVLPEV